MLNAVILTLALASFNPFHLNVRPGFYLTCLLVIPEEASLMVCLADRQTDVLMECGNTGNLELETMEKEWFEYVLGHISLSIVRYVFGVLLIF